MSTLESKEKIESVISLINRIKEIRNLLKNKQIDLNTSLLLLKEAKDKYQS